MIETSTKKYSQIIIIHHFISFCKLNKYSKCMAYFMWPHRVLACTWISHRLITCRHLLNIAEFSFHFHLIWLANLVEVSFLQHDLAKMSLAFVIWRNIGRILLHAVSFNYNKIFKLIFSNVALIQTICNSDILVQG